MNMIKPVQAMTAMAVAVSFLSLTPQVYSQVVLGVNYKNFKLECNQSTILSGFKFTLTKCNKNLGQITINNTYNNAKKLGIRGNLVNSNGRWYLDNRRDGYNIIDFTARANLSLNISVVSAQSPRLYIFPANSNLKLIKTVLISCNDGTQKIAGLIFTPTCSNRDAKFIVENTNNIERRIVTYGKIGNFSFRNFKIINSKSQQRVDLSAFSQEKNLASKKHKLEIISSN